MTRQSDEEKLTQMLDEMFKAGTLSLVSKMQMLEQFRASTAQRKAATYTLYAAIATAICAFAAVAGVWISIFDQHSN